MFTALPAWPDGGAAPLLELVLHPARARPAAVRVATVTPRRRRPSALDMPFTARLLVLAHFDGGGVDCRWAGCTPGPPGRFGRPLAGVRRLIAVGIGVRVLDDPGFRYVGMHPCGPGLRAEFGDQV